MSRILKVLVACEESQAVCKAFRALGHEAYSCDIQECSGGHPEWHIREDVFVVLNAFRFYTQDRREHFVNKWDLVISFPPCTDLAVSGARWFDKKRLSGEQQESISFFLDLYQYSDAVEQPIGIFGGGEYLKKWFPFYYKRALELGVFSNPKQIIQPWMFGHGEQKATVIYRKNRLPGLLPTHIVQGREQRVWKLPPSADRAKQRSKTFPGIAKAIAFQYSAFIKSSLSE